MDYTSLQNMYYQINDSNLSKLGEFKPIGKPQLEMPSNTFTDYLGGRTSSTPDPLNIREGFRNYQFPLSDAAQKAKSAAKTSIELPTSIDVTKSAPKKNIGKGISNMSGQTQSLLNMAGNTLGAASGSNLNPDQKATREGIRSAIGSFGPWGAAIAAASGVVDTIGDMTGLNLDNIDKRAGKKAGINSSSIFANNLMNTLPGVSLFAGLGIKKTNKAYDSAMIQPYSSGYSGVVDDLDAANQLSDKRIAGTSGVLSLVSATPFLGTLFGGKARKKANTFIAEANRKAALVKDIGEKNALIKQSTYGQDLSSQNYNLYSGNTGTYRGQVGRKGMKFQELEEAREVILKINSSNLQIFQDGGKMNIIPDGALHARKNNLGEIDEKFEDLTSKGIPVVLLDDGGELLQSAEIEAGELILTKELTDRIEELYKIGSEKAMIEAGKILSEELILNTDDKTNKLLTDEDKNIQ